MTTISPSALGQLSDRDLLAQLHRAAQDERHATAHLIALLMELDARKLYLAEGCASLFVYCTQVLHLTEHAALNRIDAERKVRQFPVILERLVEGTLSLTAVRLLGPHLTSENHITVLDAARHKSKRDVEWLVATLAPRPDVPATIRKLPAPKSIPVLTEKPIGAVESKPSFVCEPTMVAHQTHRAEIKPLAPERYKVQFTVSRETHEKLRRARDLLRHSIPNGDPAAIFDKALTVLLAELSKRKLAATTRPKTTAPPARTSRHIPAAVKRDVWQRDSGQCAFVGTQGRCMEKGFLEFHHIHPYAAGGETSVANLELRCRAHNAYEAERYFGPRQLPLVREERVVYGADGSPRSGTR